MTNPLAFGAPAMRSFAFCESILWRSLKRCQLSILEAVWRLEPLFSLLSRRCSPFSRALGRPMTFAHEPFVENSAANPMSRLADHGSYRESPSNRRRSEVPVLGSLDAYPGVLVRRG